MCVMCVRWWHFVARSTRLCMFDEKQYALVWDAVLAFPIKFKDLTLNSRLVSGYRPLADLCRAQRCACVCAERSLS
jgi:hypothetical protein